MHRRFIQAAVSGRTSAVAVELASDKDLTKLVLEQAAVPVGEFNKAAFSFGAAVWRGIFPGAPPPAPDWGQMIAEAVPVGGF